MKTHYAFDPSVGLAPVRSRAERFLDSYAMLRVGVARLMRGDKPRFKTLFK